MRTSYIGRYCGKPGSPNEKAGLTARTSAAGTKKMLLKIWVECFANLVGKLDSPDVYITWCLSGIGQPIGPSPPLPYYEIGRRRPAAVSVGSLSIRTTSS